MRIHFIVPIVLALLAGCDKGAGNRAGDTGGATSDPGSKPADPGGTGTATGVSIEPLATTTLYTSDTADNSCVSFTVKAANGSAPSPDTGVTITVESSMSDKGAVNPNSGVTDSSGNFQSSYCAGKVEGSATIVVKSGAFSANSSKITVTKKATYTFAYSSSDVPGTSPTDATIYLNTLDSGPNDCTMLYFKLSKSAAGVTGAKVDFTTQVDFPSGSKLAKKADLGAFDTDPKTLKKFAKFSGVSSSNGEFAVPVCAGVSLGSILVSATFTDKEEERNYTVHSPVIRITSGLTNFINYSLKFNPQNGRTLRAYYNTNSEFDLGFEVSMGARFDGDAISDYPVSIATEVGRYTLTSGGFLDPELKTVPVKLHALHLVDNYPYAMLNFRSGAPTTSIYPLAQTRCEPNQIAAWIKQKNAGAPLPFSTLRKNWTSSLVYAVRGQEYFYDANHNGIYDAGGTGFWDKNQNGIYDDGDLVTFPVGGTFDPASEWFIDLPTPFVDVNDDNDYTPNVDYPLGEAFAAPNGKRDSDALIWKKETFPISMGPSAFSLRTSIIESDAITGALESPRHELFSGTPDPVSRLYAFGEREIIPSYLWSNPNDAGVVAGTGYYKFINYMQDLCGNLLPGGSAVKYSVETVYAPKYGDRIPYVYLYRTPGDEYLEPTRQLLGSVSGGDATINFNSVDHPSKDSGYPIFGAVEVPPCNNVCDGAVLVGGVACDGWYGNINLTIAEPKLDQHGEVTTGMFRSMRVPAVKTCACASNATFKAGSCVCPDGMQYTAGTPACIKPT